MEGIISDEHADLSYLFLKLIPQKHKETWVKINRNNFTKQALVQT